jgi:hypothetical protein
LSGLPQDLIKVHRRGSHAITPHHAELFLQVIACLDGVIMIEIAPGGLGFFPFWVAEKAGNQHCWRVAVNLSLGAFAAHGTNYTPSFNNP